MNSIKILFNEEKTKIKFEKYYFNGISPPIDIEIKNIQCSSFEVYWKFDYNSFDLDKNEIKFILEIKKENGNFSQIYEGDKKIHLVEGLLPNTNYEIRICSKYNDIKIHIVIFTKLKH